MLPNGTPLNISKLSHEEPEKRPKIVMAGIAKRGVIKNLSFMCFQYCICPRVTIYLLLPI